MISKYHFSLLALLASCSAVAANSDYSHPSQKGNHNQGNPWNEKYKDIGGAGYSGLSTFAHLEQEACLNDLSIKSDVAVLGVPFDGLVTFRPGARFGPYGIRSGSRRQAPPWAYSPYLEVNPYQAFTVKDCGDVPVNPFDPTVALDQVYTAAATILKRKVLHPDSFQKRSMQKGLDGKFHPRILHLGGDHTIALPILHALHEVYGGEDLQDSARNHPEVGKRLKLLLPLHGRFASSSPEMSVLQYRVPRGWEKNKTVINHGNPFAIAYDEGYLAANSSIHAGIRSRMISPTTYEDDAKTGFRIIHAADIDDIGVTGIVQQIRERVGTNPLMISLDIDVLDPAYAPATGTPESGGWTTRELRAIIQGLRGLNIVEIDIVEVAPAYDTAAEITNIAAADLAYDLLSLLALGVDRDPEDGSSPIEGLKQKPFEMMSSSVAEVLEEGAKMLRGLWI